MNLAVLCLAMSAAVLPWMTRRAESPTRRRRSRRRSDGPDVVDPAALLDLLEIALAAGAAIPAALTALAEAVAPAHAGDRLRAAGTALRLGAGWQEAWHRCGPALQPIADVLEAAWTDGVDPTMLVRHRAVTIRARRSRESKKAAARLGARLVLPLGLCFLPAFVLLSMVPVLLSGVGVLFTG